MPPPIQGSGGGNRPVPANPPGTNPASRGQTPSTTPNLPSGKKPDSDFFERAQNQPPVLVASVGDTGSNLHHAGIMRSRERGQPGVGTQQGPSPKVAPARSERVPSSAPAFSKKELLQTLTLLENLADSGFELNIAGLSIRTIAGVKILNTKHDNQINLEELEKGYQRLKKLLEKPKEGLPELHKLDKSWIEVLERKDVNPDMFQRHYWRLMEAAEFMLRHGRDIAHLNGDKQLISPEDIEKLFE